MTKAQQQKQIANLVQAYVSNHGAGALPDLLNNLAILIEKQADDMMEGMCRTGVPTKESEAQDDETEARAMNLRDAVNMLYAAATGAEEEMA